MKLFLKKLLSRYGRSFLNHRYQMYGGKTYAQHGDDLILLNIFNRLGIQHPSYLDIGAHHPFLISNTALFYERGSRGINVEANPNLIGLFFKYRPEDINLNIGVAAEAGRLTFYTYDDLSGRNSFKREALADIGVKGQIDLPVTTIEDIVQQYGHGQYPDLLTIDVEGLDKDILASINYERNAPKVICVEVHAGPLDTENELRNLLVEKGYFPFCWAGANIMFIRNEYKQRMY